MTLNKNIASKHKFRKIFIKKYFLDLNILEISSNVNFLLKNSFFSQNSGNNSGFIILILFFIHDSRISEHDLKQYGIFEQLRNNK